MLKYPSCEICQFLKEIGVEDEIINDYHEGKIDFTDLPDFAQEELIEFWRENGELPPKVGQIFYLCPKCKKLHKEFEEVWTGRIKYKVKPSVFAWVIFVKHEEEMRDPEKLIYTKCPKCGIISKTPSSEFVVEVKNGKIVPWGNYWLKHRGEFEEIAKSLKLEPLIEE